ncbi:MAG: hypothetical protein ACI4CY_05505 [Candidatus Gastranaerophilaceae bacterium]
MEVSQAQAARSIQVPTKPEAAKAKDIAEITAKIPDNPKLNGLKSDIAEFAKSFSVPGDGKSENSAKNGLAAGTSFVAPGAGQFINGDYMKGAFYTAAGLMNDDSPFIKGLSAYDAYQNRKTTSTGEERPAWQRGLITGSSLTIPGLGQAINGDYMKALAFAFPKPAIRVLSAYDAYNGGNTPDQTTTAPTEPKQQSSPENTASREKQGK